MCKERLLQRLQARGIPPVLIRWINAFCSERTASISVNGYTSPIVKVATEQGLVTIMRISTKEERDSKGRLLLCTSARVCAQSLSSVPFLSRLTPCTVLIFSLLLISAHSLHIWPSLTPPATSPTSHYSQPWRPSLRGQFQSCLVSICGESVVRIQE